MRKHIARSIAIVAFLATAAVVGFLFWRSLFMLLYAGTAILGALICGCLVAVAAFRKKKSELVAVFAGCAIVAACLFSGALARSTLSSDAMISESLRLVQRAEEFRKKEGHVPPSASVMLPRDSAERIVAWLAGNTVSYHANPDGYFITRGEFIVGETYSSYTRAWEVSKT
ncbi:MAG: hypothetical protein U1F61_17025 [Opitutaceae bacterium]